MPPLEDLESAFHKRKDKIIDDLSSSFNKIVSYKRTPNAKGIGYEPETETKGESIEVVKSKVEEMADLEEMSMEE